MAERTLICRKCDRQTPVIEMKYFNDSSTLVCKDCYNHLKQPDKYPAPKHASKLKTGIATTTTATTNQPKLQTSQTTTTSKPKQENSAPRKARYKCMRCNHLFMLKQGFKQECPFCSHKDIVLQDWDADLDALIKDSSRKEFDF